MKFSFRQPIGMGTRREFRHHAAERPVRLILAGDALCQYAAVGAHQGHGGFVATGFDSENKWPKNKRCRHRSQLGPVLPIGNARAISIA